MVLTTKSNNQSKKQNARKAFSVDEVNALKRSGTDIDFISKIQPQGGITFDDNHMITGDGYVACLTVHTYPKDPNILWLVELMNNDFTVGTVDVGTDNSTMLRGQMDRSLQELSDRAQRANKATQASDAQAEYQELLDYANQINQGAEVPKKIVSRIFVYGSTLEQLEERVSNLRDRLKGVGYEASVYLFIQDKEFKSLEHNLSDQQKELTKVRPQPVPALTLGMGAPFNHQSLSDPRGIPLGITSTGGAFILDQFRSTNTRRSFNMMVLGKMGAGKSTFLKMVEEGSFARNMYVRAIDKTKEYDALVRSQGGNIINLDGSEGMINPLEVMATVTDTSGQIIDELGSFAQHINKVSTQFRMINNNELDSSDVGEFETFLTLFYIAIGLLPANFNDHPETVKITGLDPLSYPTFTEFSDWLDKNVTQDFLDRQHATVARRESIERMELSIKRMISNYKRMFDGHSTVTNLAEEKIVVFDTSSVSQMNKNVYQAQLFSALSLIWTHALRNGRKQNYLLEKGQITRTDVEYFNVILDECHNIINAENIFAVDYVKNFEREMRKFNAGVIFATQSPQEMVPDHVETAALSALKTVFELTQYKVTMLMDPAQINKMRQLLGDSLTESDFSQITTLHAGQAIVNTGGRENYTVNFTPNARQLELFHGGQ